MFALIFDLHCDTLLGIYHAKRRGNPFSFQSSSLQIDEEKLKKGGYFAQCFAAFVPVSEENPYALCKELIDTYDAVLSSSKLLSPVLKFSDFAKNKKAGKISSMLTMEDAAPIGTSFENLREFYRRGVRMIGLTWNYPNAVGYPNYKGFTLGQKPDLFTPEIEHGLTEFGIALVEEMNSLGIVIDVSHLSDKGFYDVIQRSKKPIMASHSNARGVCRNVRNLSDDMLKNLAENGGVLGINYANGFLCEEEERGRQTIPFVIEHINYIKRKIGVEHIALGSDFDGIDPNISLADASYLPLLIKELEKAGFTAKEIEGIAYQNALRVFKENMQE